jgi:hypothetical protein
MDLKQAGSKQAVNNFDHEFNPKARTYFLPSWSWNLALAGLVLFAKPIKSITYNPTPTKTLF